MKKQIASIPVFVFALIAIVIFGIRTISTPEIWRHIANGQALSSNLPQIADKTDPFCFTTVGYSWISVTPIYDRIMFALSDAPAAISIIHILLAIGGLILLIPTAKKWANSLSITIALFLCGILFEPFFYPTPIFFGMFFFSLTFAILQLKIKQPVRLASLIIIQILWTNFHQSFLLGPLLCLLSILTTNRKTKSGKKEAKDLIITAGAMLLATVINPYGLALHTYIVKHINELLIPQFYVFVSPFRPYFEQPAMRSLLTLMLLIGAGGLITLKKRLPPVLTSLAIIGSLIMIRSLYFSVPFVYFAFPFLALSIQAIGEATAQATEPLLGKNSHYLKKVMHVAVLIFIAVAIWSNISNSIYARSGSASKFGLGFTKNITPANYIDEIVNHPKFPIDILNMPFDGAYLSYKFPSKKFACDLRNDLFSEKNLSNLNLALLGNNDEWKDLTSEYNPKALILNNFSMQSPLILKQFIKREWKLIYFDGAYSILVSPNSEIADIAKEFNGAKKGLESLNAELNQYNKNSDSLIYKPNSPQLIGAGASFLALNRYKEANAVYATILENNHFMKSAWLGYGQSLLGLREFEKASKALEEAVKVMPNNKQALIGLGQAYRLSKNEAGFKFVEKRLEKMNSQSDKNKSAN